jgi:ribosomal protein S27AE
MPKSYIEFKLTKKGEKTNFYDVLSRNSGSSLGFISWHSPWRQYVFFPDEDTIWNVGCLEEIQIFINNLMQERKPKLKILEKDQIEKNLKMFKEFDEKCAKAGLMTKEHTEIYRKYNAYVRSLPLKCPKCGSTNIMLHLGNFSQYHSCGDCGFNMDGMDDYELFGPLEMLNPGERDI